LFVLSINALDHNFTAWVLRASTLLVCFLQYRKVCSRSFRLAEPHLHEVFVALKVHRRSILSLFLSASFSLKEELLIRRIRMLSRSGLMRSIALVFRSCYGKRRQ
jgi:hypothetical protein